MPDLTKISDEELAKIAGVNLEAPEKIDNDLSSYSDEDLFMAAGIAPKDKESDSITSSGLYKSLPTVGQTVGGIAGGVAGARVKRPYVGAAVGGTAGRGLGRIAQEQMKLEEEQPIAKLLRPLSFPTVAAARMDNKERLEFGKEMLKTGAVELATIPIGIGASKLFSMVGKGIMKQLLSPRVAERGFDRGWKTLLDPEFYKGRIPKMIVKKMDRFFTRLTKVSGKEVDKLIKTKYKKKLINITDVKEEVRFLLPESGNPSDLLELTASKSQKQLLNDITNDVLKMRGNVRKAETVWNLRRKLDKAIYGKSWTPDAEKYLRGLRKALNKPILGLGDDVAESFGRYSFVKNAEDDLGKKFLSIKGTEGEAYAPKLEGFVGNILSTSKDETIRMLKDLDGVLDADDKIVTKLLDYAAAETLQKEVMGMGIWQRMLVGILGGKKRIAQLGKFVQSPITQFGKKLTGRKITTGITEEVINDNQ